MSIDPRIDLLSGIVAKPEGDPVDALTAAADALAHMGPIPAGEAKLILAALAESWGADCPRIDAIASWASSWAESRAQQGDAVTGDELARHLASQASGRYALAEWPWPVLTRESRSLMPGSVTLVCGAPGASKSWLALTCLRHWTANGVPAAVLMLEETAKWHLQRALAQCAASTDLLKPEWIAANKDAALALYERHKDELSLIRARLTCDGDLTLAKCAEWVEAQCKDRKRVIVVDPISLADPGSERSWDADRKFMARAKVAVEKAGASLVLVTHPRKSGGKQAGPPELDDLAGGAAYGRACASALWVSGVPGEMETPVITEDERYIVAVPHKTIRIMKARNSVGCGKIIAYQFKGLQFDELGVIAGKEYQKRPEQAVRLNQKPHGGEDLFNGP